MELEQEQSTGLAACPVSPPMEASASPSSNWFLWIVWNCRGPTSPSSLNYLRDLIKHHRQNILVLLETRVPSSRSWPFFQKLNFTKMITVEAVGFTGGNWLIWDCTIIDMSILSSTDQVLTVAVNGSKYVDWVFSALYASPRKHLRDELWLYLCRIGRLITSPWLLAGDFNQGLHSEDKKGGRPVTCSQTLSLWEVVEAC